jgi:putative membrane protein
MNTPPIPSPRSPEEISVELSSRRTGMSFQRTRMSADRTLMSVIRTSLSLISFGFTIFQVFQKLRDQHLVTSAAPARNFGIALVALGISMLVIGITYHVQFMLGLRREREAMTTAGLIHGESRFPPSYTLLTAVLLFLIGVAAILEHGVPDWALRLRKCPNLPKASGRDRGQVLVIG